LASTILLAAVTLLAVSAVVSSRNRRTRLARIGLDWGEPRDRVRKIDAIADYYRSRTDSARAADFLDDRTWDDLNLDAVFQRLDRAESTLGQQVLYYRLRSAPVAANLHAFEALVTRMSTDVEARERARIALTRLQNPAGYDLWWLAQPDTLERRPWHVIYPLVTAVMVAALLAAFFVPGALLILIVGSVVNLTIRTMTARRIGPVLGPFRQISALIAVAEGLRFLAGADTDRVVGALRGDVAALGRLKAIVRRISFDPLSAGELAFDLMEYLNLIFLLDVNAVYFGAGELRRCGPTLLRVIQAVGDVDAAISIASFRAGTVGWTRPRFVQAGDRASLRDIRHPLVHHAVPNSIELGPPHGVLVTGSNMSGKTTFVRTVGVNAVLAQTINTCLATAYEAPVLRVRSCIGRSDDLVSGKSDYIVEVEAVLAMVQASAGTDPHLFLFDELFRGTNTVERIAGAEAVLTELIFNGGTSKPHLVLAATHDRELVDLLSEVYAPYHFGDELGPDGLIFDHRLRPGVTTTRNAIALLRLYGAPAAMVTRALQRAAILDSQRGKAPVG
jgi:hypothetical protein